MAARSSLQELSQGQLALIADALNESEVPVQNNIILGNRFYIESLFEDLFLGSGNDQKVQNLITANIRKQGRFFGGPCSRQELDECYSNDDINRDINPTSQVVRQGLIAKSCDEILQIDGALTALVNSIDGDLASKPSGEDMEKLFKRFAIGRDLDDSLKSALLELSEDGFTIRKKTTDSWRFPAIALCQSVFLEMI